MNTARAFGNGWSVVKIVRVFHVCLGVLAVCVVRMQCGEDINDIWDKCAY